MTEEPERYIGEGEAMNDNPRKLKIPQLGTTQAALFSQLLVCNLIDALVAKGLVSEADVDAIIGNFFADIKGDQRQVASELRKLLEKRGLPGLSD